MIHNEQIVCTQLKVDDSQNSEYLAFKYINTSLTRCRNRTVRLELDKKMSGWFKTDDEIHK